MGTNCLLISTCGKQCKQRAVTLWPYWTIRQATLCLSKRTARLYCKLPMSHPQNLITSLNHVWVSNKFSIWSSFCWAQNQRLRSAHLLLHFVLKSPSLCHLWMLLTSKLKLHCQWKNSLQSPRLFLLHRLMNLLCTLMKVCNVQDFFKVCSTIRNGSWFTTENVLEMCIGWVWVVGGKLESLIRWDEVLHIIWRSTIGSYVISWHIKIFMQISGTGLSS